mmetsp:Transcript_2859/g.10915  ORF Transcript_2859/g.10915 Transcript_2859/m.10915 type:complete len:530 (-) Transcript_2859:2018-3607(-)
MTLTPSSSKFQLQKSSNPILSFYQRQKRARLVAQKQRHDGVVQATILDERHKQREKEKREARRVYKKAFLNRERRKSVVEEFADEECFEGSSSSMHDWNSMEETDGATSSLSILDEVSTRGADSETSGRDSKSSGASSSPALGAKVSIQRRGSLIGSRRNSQLNGPRTSNQRRNSRPRSAASALSAGVRGRRHSVVLPSTKRSDNIDRVLARTREESDTIKEWTTGGADSPRVNSTDPQLFPTSQRRGSMIREQQQHDNNMEFFAQVTKRKRRPNTASHQRRFTEPFHVKPDTPRRRPSTGKPVSCTERRLSVPYPGGAPPSVYDRARLEMSRWKKRPKSAKPNYELKRVTMLLYEKIVPDVDENLFPPPTEQQIERKKEDEALEMELAKRRIKRSTFQFLESDNPQHSKEVHNLSEDSFIGLREFIKKEEMRSEIFKYDHFVPPFSKTRLNMYRLGSHNDAYDAYDTLDYITDKNMYQYMDRKLRRHSVGNARRRKSLTRAYIKSMPIKLGAQKDDVLRSRIREEKRR